MPKKTKQKRLYNRFTLSLNEVGISEKIIKNIAVSNCTKNQKVQILFAALSGRNAKTRKRREFFPDENF